MRFLYAFDLSMSNTGVAIFSLQGELIHATSIATDAKDTHGLRLAYIAGKLQNLMMKYPPEIVVLERAFQRFNTSTAVLYRVHGVVNYLFALYPQIYYAPKHIKACLVGGNATKKMVREKVEQMFNVEFENEDESDACAVGATYFINNELLHR